MTTDSLLMAAAEVAQKVREWSKDPSEQQKILGVVGIILMNDMEEENGNKS